MIVLEILEGNSRGAVFKFEDTTISLGRADTNSLVLRDYHLSGQHGQIFLEGDRFIYRDLRSTNGSAVRRGSETLTVDASVNWEVTLHPGDQLQLGDPKDPVVVRLGLPESVTEQTEDLTDRLIASRSIVDLPKVAEAVEDDPAIAVRIYKALSPLSTRLEVGETLEAVAEAAFQLLPRATHVSILLRSDSDKDRFTVALARQRQQRPRGTRAPAPTAVVTAQPAKPVDPIRASRAVLRRVLEDRAALLLANAAEELGSSESIMGGQILSIVAVPLWRGDQITGLIQADNRASAGMFTEGDLEVSLLLGAQAALALDNAGLVSRLKVAEEKRRFENIIGESSAMRSVLAQLEKVLDTRATVCIEGETGTGKELIASGIHYQSRRNDKLFVAQNCAALPENLLESELFGHKKGSFTSADADKKGLFEIADGGTLFLDEVGEMPLSLQAKLLRTLQEGVIRPVGSTSEKQVDVRIICATNRDLEAEVAKGAFRQDLYYRLMVFPIRLPPLRERREDVPLLAEHFLKRYVQEYRRDIAGLSQEALDALASYAWPGNIRELENEIQRLVIQAEPGAWIEVGDLSP